MPIVESTKPGSLLTQGDILKDITLFATNEDWLEKGGAPVKMCLVISARAGSRSKSNVGIIENAIGRERDQ